MIAEKPFFYNLIPKGSYVGKSSSRFPYNAYCYTCYLRSIAPPPEEDYEDVERGNEQKKTEESFWE